MSIFEDNLQSMFKGCIERSMNYNLFDCKKLCDRENSGCDYISSGSILVHQIAYQEYKAYLDLSFSSPTQLYFSCNYKFTNNSYSEPYPAFSIIYYYSDGTYSGRRVASSTISGKVEFSSDANKIPIKVAIGFWAYSTSCTLTNILLKLSTVSNIDYIPFGLVDNGYEIHQPIKDKLRDYKIYGNSYQPLEPSIEKPCDIISLGENGHIDVNVATRNILEPGALDGDWSLDNQPSVLYWENGVATKDRAREQTVKSSFSRLKQGHSYLYRVYLSDTEYLSQGGAYEGLVLQLTSVDYPYSYWIYSNSVFVWNYPSGHVPNVLPRYYTTVFKVMIVDVTGLNTSSLAARDAIPWIPYYNKTTSISLGEHEPLRALTYRYQSNPIVKHYDCIDFKNKKIIRRVGRQIFTGNESWYQSSNHTALGRWCNSKELQDHSSYPKGYLCNIALEKYSDKNFNFYCYDINSNNWILFTNTQVTEFKNYLQSMYASGNPVYIDYILQEPIEEDFPECPDIEIPDFDCIITVSSGSEENDLCYITSNTEDLIASTEGDILVGNSINEDYKIGASKLEIEAYVK